jgi:hypothetical protein
MQITIVINQGGLGQIGAFFDLMLPLVLAPR